MVFISPNFCIRSLAVLVTFAVLGCFAPAAAQTTNPDMASYYDQSFFLSAPPAAFGDGLYGTANPALASMIGSDLALAWSSDRTDLASVRDWGVFSNMGGLSSSYTRLRRAGQSVNAYHVGLSGGNRSGAVGVGYQFYTGDATSPRAVQPSRRGHGASTHAIPLGGRCRKPCGGN